MKRHQLYSGPTDQRQLVVRFDCPMDQPEFPFCVWNQTFPQFNFGLSVVFGVDPGLDALAQRLLVSGASGRSASPSGLGDRFLKWADVANWAKAHLTLHMHGVNAPAIDLDSEQVDLVNPSAAAASKASGYCIALVLQDDDGILLQMIRDPVSMLTFERQCAQWVWVCDNYDFNPRHVSSNQLKGALARILARIAK